MDQFCYFSRKYFVNFIKNIIKPRDIIEMAAFNGVTKFK